MAQVARLNIDLVARTAKMTAGFKKAQGILSGFQASIATMAKRVAVGAAAAIAIAIAAVYATKKLYGFVKAQLEVGDALGVVSQQLGIATQDLMVLQGAAAEFANMEGEDLNRMLVKFSRTIAEASNGGKGNKVTALLSDLGLEAKKLKEAGLGKAFEDVGKAIAKIPNPMDRLNAAQKLFGKGSERIVPLLIGEAKALQEIREQMKASGIKIPQADIQAIGAAADRFDRISLILKMLKLQIIGGMAPAIGVVAEKMTGLGIAFLKWSDIASKAVNTVNVSLAAMYQYLAYIQTWMAGWRVLLSDRGKDRNEAIARLLNLQNTNWAQKFFDDMEAFRQKVFGGGAGGEGGNSSLGDLAKALDMPALQRGDPGVQKYITGRESKMKELVDVGRRTENHTKQTAENTKKMKEDFSNLANVGIVTF